MKPLYVFIHLPKCAGTTIKTILEQNIENTFRYPRGVEPECGWQNVNCIHGHFTPVLPVEKGEFKNRKLRYFTLLRHPVDRTISYYNFSMGTHAPHKIIPFEEWIDDDSSETHMKYNTMCYFLGNGENNKAHELNLKIAKHNLSNVFFLFGTVDKIDCFGDELYNQVLVNFKFYAKENVWIKNATKKHFIKRGDFDDLIIQKNDLDMELWEFANEFLRSRK